MAFKVNEVDEKTNIYHYYEDIYYNEFINEAKIIFNKYNDNLECNPNNLNLLLENDKCIFDTDEQAHGGYKCENGKWGTECKKIYCNIGYYYNKNKDECEIDQCTIDEYIDLNHEEEKEYVIDPDKTYIFELNTNLYFYVFQSPIDDIINYDTMEKCPRLCAVKDTNIDKIYINYFHNLESQIKIKVTSIKSNINIKSGIIKSKNISHLGLAIGLYIFQLTEDNYLFTDSFDPAFNLYYAKYEDKMTVNDILTLNKNYFKNGNSKITLLEKGNIYIISFNQNAYFMKLYIYNLLPTNINIENGNFPILYLQKGKTYELDFSKNNMAFIIKLYQGHTSSEIDIIENENNSKTISGTDKYFKPSIEIYKGKLKLIVKEDNALIEILYSLGEENTKILNDENGGEYIVSEQVILVEYIKNQTKTIQVIIESEQTFKFRFYSGFSLEYYFYYNKGNYNGINKYVITIENPIKDINLENDEKYYIALMPEKNVQNQKILISYKYIDNPIETLYEKLDETYINNVISNLTSIIQNYIFVDISRNPPTSNMPEGYQHEPINIIESLNKINRTNRTFYDFYREVIKIKGAVRDGHFRFWSVVTPKGINFNYMTACLPFSIYVEKSEKDIPEIYVKYFSDCGDYFSDEVKNYINGKINKHIPLKKINGKNAFDFIQNFGMEFSGYKSPHAQFTSVKAYSFHRFYLNRIPYTPKELEMKFEFESREDDQDNKLNINYYIIVGKLQDLQKLYGSSDFNKEEFDEFYENETKKYIESPIIKPDIFELMRKYKIKKGILKEKKLKSGISWDYSTTEEDGIKCRIDKDKEINFVIQTSFSLDENGAYDVIIKCTRAFYQNNYPIVVVQSLNGGGNGRLALIFNQLLQIKIQTKERLATSHAKDMKDIFYNYWYKTFGNLDTCKIFNNPDEVFNGTINDYSTETEEIIHKKSKMMQWTDKEKRKELRDLRLEFSQYKKLKKPTDIIIFADSYSYSATSYFIKGFQNTGGAIIVGYNGNPNLANNYFDASQAPSTVMDFSFTEESKKLKNSFGWVIDGITFIESYDVDYQNKKSIPREYILDPIDVRSDIYEPYSDDKYDIFVSEAKRFFELYNQKDTCNPKNPLLVFDTEECYNIEGDNLAHGGYPCGEDGHWNKSVCKKFYCDIGYYYDKLKDECIRDICDNDPGEIEIPLNGEYNETIELNKDNNMEYIFRVKNNKYIYFFKANETGIFHYGPENPCSDLCALQNGKLHINYYRNITEDKIIEIQIYSFPISDKDIEIGSRLLNNGELRSFTFLQKKILITLFKQKMIIYHIIKFLMEHAKL